MGHGVDGRVEGGAGNGAAFYEMHYAAPTHPGVLSDTLVSADVFLM